MKIIKKLIPIIGLLYFIAESFSAIRGVSFDTVDTNVQQIVHQKFHSITNLPAVANEIAGYDANKKLISHSPTATRTILGLDSNDAVTFGAVTGDSFTAGSTNMVGALAGKQPLDPDLTALAAIAGEQGAILYHNGTAWVKLVPGTSGHVLKTQGAGANPQWAAESGGGGGSAPVGTMVNSGASTQYALTYYTDLTGTNMAASLISTDSTLTNLLVGGVKANVLVLTNISESLSNIGLGTEDSPTFATVTVGTTNVAGALASAATTTSITATQTGTHASPSVANPLAPGNLTGPSHVIWYGATGEIDLPTAAANTLKVICVYNTGAFTVTIDPNGAEIIVRDGTVQTGGVSMTLNSGAGNYVWLMSDGVRWVTFGFKGTLATGS